jgi:hypothetical protein
MALKIKDLVRGTTRVINVTFTAKDGTPHNLTGGSVFFAATTEVDPVSDATAAIDIAPVTVHTAPLLGKSQIVLSAIETRVEPGIYNFGAQAVLSDGTVIEETGKFKVKADYKISVT